MSDFALEHFLPYRLSVAARRVSDGFAAHYRAEFGLSVAEWRVMAHLSQDENVSVRDIHARADLEKSKASRAVSRLEAAGLVAKEAAKGDRRLLALSLTAKGRDVMAALIPGAEAYQAALTARLSAEDRAALDRILASFTEPTREKAAR